MKWRLTSRVAMSWLTVDSQVLRSLADNSRAMISEDRIPKVRPVLFPHSSLAPSWAVDTSWYISYISWCPLACHSRLVQFEQLKRTHRFADTLTDCGCPRKPPHHSLSSISSLQSDYEVIITTAGTAPHQLATDDHISNDRLGIGQVVAVCVCVAPSRLNQFQLAT